MEVMKKMTRNNNLDELLKALETIRSSDYPELKKELLEQLLQVEYENQDNRAEAQLKAMKLIDDYFSKLIGQA